MQAFLKTATREFRKYKGLADLAVDQAPHEAFFDSPDGESNSLAIILKHVSGNMRSRWTDFLTTDGDKADRNRDSEFEREAADTRTSIIVQWEKGWALLFSALAPLVESDLALSVTIRGEPHTVLEAISRQLTHYAYHVGQIVFLAKHQTGPRWISLSIPRGKSKDYEVAKNGTRYMLS